MTAGKLHIQTEFRMIKVFGKNDKVYFLLTKFNFSIDTFKVKSPERFCTWDAFKWTQLANAITRGKTFKTLKIFLSTFTFPIFSFFDHFSNFVPLPFFRTHTLRVFTIFLSSVQFNLFTKFVSFTFFVFLLNWHYLHLLFRFHFSCHFKDKSFHFYLYSIPNCLPFPNIQFFHEMYLAKTLYYTNDKNRFLQKIVC